MTCQWFLLKILLEGLTEPWRDDLGSCSSPDTVPVVGADCYCSRLEMTLPWVHCPGSRDWLLALASALLLLLFLLAEVEEVLESHRFHNSIIFLLKGSDTYWLHEPVLGRAKETITWLSEMIYHCSVKPFAPLSPQGRKLPVLCN